MYIQKLNLLPSIGWSPWLGCHRVSEACLNCFINHLDDFQPKEIRPDFSRLKRGTFVIVSLATDFFLEEGDSYREKAWETIKSYPNLIFNIFTKRVDRIEKCLPKDWNDGYENVILTVTMENQKRIDERLPFLLKLPFKHKAIACCPLLEEIDLSIALQSKQIELIECGGEKFTHTPRILRYKWVKKLSDQCKEYNVRFSFMQAGYAFEKDNVIYRDSSICYHSKIAEEQNLDNPVPLHFKLDNKIFIKD